MYKNQKENNELIYKPTKPEQICKQWLLKIKSYLSEEDKINLSVFSEDENEYDDEQGMQRFLLFYVFLDFF